MTKEEAIVLFDTTAKSLKRFKKLDVFNRPNVLEGWMSMRNNVTYGSIVIDTVNGDSIPPRFIQGMPKLRYPFYTQVRGEDAERVYTWDKDAVQLIIMEKYDGTNILSYVYEYNNQIFTTYKTRLTAIVHDNDLWGNFVSLIRLVESRKDLHTPTWSNNYIYELCGYRNPHMVKYDFDVDLKPIAIANNDLKNIVPWVYSDNSTVINLNNPEELTELYTNQQAEDNNTILASNTKEGEFPLEGKVFYVYSNNQYTVVKCKPDVIEKIHFARGGIPKDEIRITCIKAMEAYSLDEITKDKVETLLLEDWSEEALKCSQLRIQEAYNELIEELKYRAFVKASVLSLGVDSTNKGIVMRALARRKIINPREMRCFYFVAQIMGLVD